MRTSVGRSPPAQTHAVLFLALVYDRQVQTPTSLKWEASSYCSILVGQRTELLTDPGWESYLVYMYICPGAHTWRPRIILLLTLCASGHWTQKLNRSLLQPSQAKPNLGVRGEPTQ